MNTFKRKALSCAILGGLGAIAATTGGCGIFQPAPQMTAEQLAAAAKDKNASVGCASGVGTGGKGTVVFVNVDKSSINKGSVIVDDGCKVTITAGDGKP